MNQFKAAWNVWTSYKGFKGKFFAFFYILTLARDYIQIHTRIRFWLPFEAQNSMGHSDFAQPIRIENARIIEEKIHPLRTRLHKRAKPRINFLVPTIDPQLLFGGYIAFFNFIRKVQDRGHATRLIICDPTPLNAKGLREQAKAMELLETITSRADIFIVSDDKPLRISPEDTYVAYSTWTAYLADKLAHATNDKPFVFFIQELEAIFHECDSFHAMCMGAYKLNHRAIFNSELLKLYFKRKEIGVFEPGRTEPETERCIHFSHALASVEAPEVEDLENRTERKLLFYARPENHAGRNLFELGFLALKQAIAEGIFPDSWRFYGIGSLGFSGYLDLGNGHAMEMLPRCSPDEYAAMLQWFDMGMSLMYAPHPSVPPLELAAAGVVSLTTTFDIRKAEDMQALSKNILAVNADLGSLVKGFEEGVKLAEDFETRIANAEFDWSRSWDTSFHDDFMKDAEHFIITSTT